MANWYSQPPDVPGTVFTDIEKITGAVAKYFPIYSTQMHFDMVSMKCNVDTGSLESNFEALRKEMKALGYIPMISEEGGEYLIHVVKRPPEKFRGPWLNLILLIVTIASTVIAGAALWASAFGGGMFEGHNLLNGALYFALPLMLILGIHEMAHYFAAKRHAVAASLPFFIPAPFILGTMGAFISIREPIPSKKALLDIGFAGPIAGFIVAIPVLCMGLVLSGDMPVAVEGETIPGGTMLIGTSVLFEAFMMAFNLPAGTGIHPMAFAGWVGFFVTALNLLPVGQLDGGHISRALLGDRSRWASYGAMGLMLFMGLVFSSSWLFFALLIMFMGLRHPPPLNDVTSLQNRKKVVGIAAALMLVLCFVPVPISQEPVNYDFAFQRADGTQESASHSHSMEVFTSAAWQNTSYPFRIVNNGNMPLDLAFEISASSNSSEPQNITAWIYVFGEPSSNASDHFDRSLGIEEVLHLSMNMTFSPVLGNCTVTVHLQETAYDWPNIRDTAHAEEHGMTLAVNFRRPP